MIKAAAHTNGGASRHISTLHSKPEWREKNMPTDDWMALTVDYHS